MVKRLLCGLAISGVAVASSSGAGRVVIIQTNAAGDNIHLIDAATNTVVAEIGGIEVNHGAAAAPDGSRLYFSNEADHTLDVVDVQTLAVTKKIPLSGRPNNISIGSDGRRVYVAIAAAPGAVDVIDTGSLERVKSIPVSGAVHNTFVTPDGRHVVEGSIAGRNLTVIDAKTEEPVWSLAFDRGVRPIAFERRGDGSTKRLFVQLSDFHGFAVVDFATRKETGRVTLPDVPPDQRHTEGLQGSPAHGLGVTPDGKTLWINSKMNSVVYAYSLPDLTLLGGVHVGDHPDWLTFTPDSARVYVANAGSNSVSVVDIASRRELTRVPVGQVPKRNITAILPDVPSRTAPAAPRLDFDVFKTRVQPIMLARHKGSARCYVCHSQSTSFRLQRLAAGAATWSDEESRKNFDAVQRLIVPGSPSTSRLLLMPLAAESGGIAFHPGGKRWLTKDDPEWQAIAAWIAGR